MPAATLFLGALTLFLGCTGAVFGCTGAVFRVHWRCIWCMVAVRRFQKPFHTQHHAASRPLNGRSAR
eukprot:3839602-Rhodomonas_salina.1